MSIKQTVKKQRRIFKDAIQTRQPMMTRLPAVMGDGFGNLRVTGRTNYVYVLIDDKPYQAFCGKVPPKYGGKVWVGISQESGENSKFYQVLSDRITSSGTDELQGAGYAPASYYEWMATNGGIDPLHVHLRAITFLKIGMSGTGGMNVKLERGFIWTGTAHKHINVQDIDLTAQIPSTASKAAYVLITLNTSGAPIQTKGGEVNIDLLDKDADIPAPPSGTAFVCGAVRVYNGQTQVLEGRTNNDFVDLRFTYFLGNAVWGSITGDITDQADLQAAFAAALDASFVLITEDLTDQVTGATAHFVLSVASVGMPMVYCNIRQQGADITMDSNMKGFTLSFTPTTSDKLIVDYYTTYAHLIFDDAGSIMFDDAGSYLLEA